MQDQEKRTFRGETFHKNWTDYFAPFRDPRFLGPVGLVSLLVFGLHVLLLLPVEGCLEAFLDARPDAQVRFLLTLLATGCFGFSLTYLSYRQWLDLRSFTINFQERTVIELRGLLFRSQGQIFSVDQFDSLRIDEGNFVNTLCLTGAQLDAPLQSSLEAAELERSAESLSARIGLPVVRGVIDALPSAAPSELETVEDENELVFSYSAKRLKGLYLKSGVVGTGVSVIFCMVLFGLQYGLLQGFQRGPGLDLLLAITVWLSLMLALFYSWHTRSQKLTLKSDHLELRGPQYLLEVKRLDYQQVADISWGMAKPSGLFARRPCLIITPSDSPVYRPRFHTVLEPFDNRVYHLHFGHGLDLETLEKLERTVRTHLEQRREVNYPGKLNRFETPKRLTFALWLSIVFWALWWLWLSR